MDNHTIETFGFPAVGRKKVTSAFDGGRLTSDGGVMLLAAAERRISLARKLAGLITDPRNPLSITYSVADILRARMLRLPVDTRTLTGTVKLSILRLGRVGVIRYLSRMTTLQDPLYAGYPTPPSSSAMQSGCSSGSR